LSCINFPHLSELDLVDNMQDAAIVLSAMSEPSQQIDSTLQKQKSSAYHEHLLDIEHMTTQPLRGRRFAIIKETIGMASA